MTTDIKFIKVLDKLYKVEKISFYHMTCTAQETDLPIEDVPEHEIFDLSDFDTFKIKLINGTGKSEIINIAEWKRNNKQK